MGFPPLVAFGVAQYAINCWRLKNAWSVRPFPFTAPLVVVKPAARLIVDFQYPNAGAELLRKLAAKFAWGKLLDGVGETLA